MASTKQLLEALFDTPAFRAAFEAAKSPRAERIHLSGLTRTAVAASSAALAHRSSRPAILVTSDNEMAESLAATASTVLEWLEPGAGAQVAVLPMFDSSPYERRSPHPELVERRAVTLYEMSGGRVRLLCVPLVAALMRYRNRTAYRSLALTIKAGDELSPEDLTQHLANVGYEANEPVEAVGQFSLRGGIVDAYSPEADRPMRIEFLGDTVESIRGFDFSTQRSQPEEEKALLLPLREFCPSPEFFRHLDHALHERMHDARARHRLAEVISPFPGWEHYAPLAAPHQHSLFDLLENPLIVWDDASSLAAEWEKVFAAWQAAYEESRDAEPPPIRPEEALRSREELARAVAGLTQFDMEELGVEGAEQSSQPTSLMPAAEGRGPVLTRDGAVPGSSLRIATQPSPKYRGSIKAMAADLEKRVALGENVILALAAPNKAERLLEVLKESHIPFEVSSELADSEKNRGSVSETPLVLIARGHLAEGAIFPEARLALISERDIFGDYVRAGAGSRNERRAAAAFISDLSDLKAGDYVVHVDHGIGLYQGLRLLVADGVSREFMLLMYRDDARLYVPLERLDLVEKYRSSEEGEKPELNPLGGTAWVRTKTRVQKALKDLAQDLLRLYAERKMLGGIAAGPDTPWQHEFEEAFPFEETADQLSAIEAVKHDLEAPEPMDRLLCGDVGYGKTEVAMRAAFKVVQDGRQVAVLAPTTVLAFQHYTTFRERMAAFPLRIEMVSRFRSATEQKSAVSDAEAGKVDILIGTHRLLSRDISFQNLGLLIVDEEQRFGVAAKEKLKSMRANVDVLTLSATPIPRTLHMALGGLRDLSVIESPPRGRLAIQTTVAAFSSTLIQSAILHEIERRGQVFYVHNRVDSILTEAAMLQKLVPQARFGIAHGQMGERELERTMMKFVQGEHEVLVATTLIENGLDIPRANTLIVNHAERFGLADLYQLRGRVGRSDRRAYAYFLVPAEESLTGIARRRLAALKEFSDLGSGFRLAALDLELRGAGNVLGREQHGHLNAIGTDLYFRMLQQAVEELRGAPPKPEIHVALNLGMDIKIPHEYVRDERQRLKIYKRIAALSTPEERIAMESELHDRYGALPSPVLRLLLYALVKARAEALQIESIERKDSAFAIRFGQETPVRGDRIQQFLRRHKGSRFRPGNSLEIPVVEEPEGLIAQVLGVLLELGVEE